MNEEIKKYIDEKFNQLNFEISNMTWIIISIMANLKTHMLSKKEIELDILKESAYYTIGNMAQRNLDEEDIKKINETCLNIYEQLSNIRSSNSIQ